MNIHISRRKTVCPLIIGNGVIKQLSENHAIKHAQNICIITDTCVAPLWLEQVKKHIENKSVCVIIIETGEKNKTMRTLRKILKEMVELGVDRSSVVITLGGGVVCDIGGLAAGLLMRGVPVIHVPTTLLAQVDASIGGKTAIDFQGLKNMVGMFYQPTAVFIDVQMLKTLPERELISGCGEIIKHAIIADNILLKIFNKKSVDISDVEWIAIIKRSCRIKKTIVQKDEEEKNGERKKLNFGHTVGHAIESISLKSDHPLLHGEAIAIGMISETRMSVLMGILSKQEEEVIRLAISQCGLPTSIANVDIEDIEKAMLHDKKNSQGKVLFSLPTKIGAVKSNCVVSQHIVHQGLKSIITNL